LSLSLITDSRSKQKTRRKQIGRRHKLRNQMDERSSSGESRCDLTTNTQPVDADIENVDSDVVEDAAVRLNDDEDVGLSDNENDRKSRKSYYSDLLKKRVKQLKKKYKINGKQLTNNGPLHETLKAYHDEYLLTANDTTTRHVSDRVREVVVDIGLIGDERRPIVWSEADKNSIKIANEQALAMPVPQNWRWAASECTGNKNRQDFNHARLKMWQDEECR